MEARRVVLALMIAFIVASTIAALTTIRQVRTANSSVPHPVTRI
jgi:hypothetical protein